MLRFYGYGLFAPVVASIHLMTAQQSLGFGVVTKTAVFTASGLRLFFIFSVKGTESGLLPNRKRRTRFGLARRLRRGEKQALDFCALALYCPPAVATLSVPPQR